MGPKDPSEAGSSHKSTAYQPVGQHDGQDGDVLEEAPASPGLHPSSPPHHSGGRRQTTMLLMAACLVILVASNVYLTLPLFSLDTDCPCRPPNVPQYFQTSPELWPGPTATGRPAFLAQTRVLEPSATFVPNEPLQTAIPIDGMQSGNQSIFQNMGFLTPYTPSPGFGVEEYPMPPGAEIVQVQMLSRHGSRYPTSGSAVAVLGEKIANASATFHSTGSLAFLNDWEYQLGAEILVPKGRQELFDSGVLHSYMYGGLYNPASRIIVRTTTQDRMLKSAENWLAGFFGLEWTNNATIEVIIEQPKFNNSLAGSLNCPNARLMATGNAARDKWASIYLQKATSRFQALTAGFDWTVEDVYAAQTMCPYETVAYGFSRFCNLFTYEEWQGFGYSIDLEFSGISAFHSPTGRAAGIGYQQEVLARLRNHTLGYSGSQINTTLDGNTETFPLNQSLYFDFSHDTNIVSILTAFGLTQFASELPTSGPAGDRNFTVAHLTPFGARLDIEIIRSPQPVSPRRDGFLPGAETKYIHFVLNQRTIPLGLSFEECDPGRKDGWCELDTFLSVQQDMPARAVFDHACFGEYDAPSYEAVTDGVPP